MSQENRDLVRRWFEALSRHDADSVADMVTSDFVNNSSTNQVRDGVRAELDYWFSAFPDASVSRISSRKGTGSLRGSPPAEHMAANSWVRLQRESGFRSRRLTSSVSRTAGSPRRGRQSTSSACSPSLACCLRKSRSVDVPARARVVRELSGSRPQRKCCGLGPAP
jgi:SnoaL-like domain